MGLTTDRQIVSLNTSHISAIETLLQKCDLPFLDCGEHIHNFYGITSGDKLVAIGAVEIKRPVALLRSIAVPAENRGQGLAVAMTHHLLDVARSNGVRELYLLTETAEHYFTRFGFCPVARDAVPVEIKSTRQFESLCPSTALAMRLEL